MPGYNITYSKIKRFLPLKILIQIPKILKIIWFEKKWIAKVIVKNKFDAIISDNRYGFYSKNITSIFITHQLLIKTNFIWLNKILQRINYGFINHFDECWIPDLENSPNISGDLSHPENLPQIPLKYLGPLSRFTKSDNQQISFKWMVIISGPEPQRTIFEHKIFDVAKKSTDNFLIVRGLPSEKENNYNFPNCKVFNHLNTIAMQAAIESSKFIISRCGYTTVMEVLSIQKKSILIPTPGQTEQEYLGQHLMKQKWCYVFKQTENFPEHLSKAETFNYNLPGINSELYKKTLTDFVASLK